MLTRAAAAAAPASKDGLGKVRGLQHQILQLASRREFDTAARQLHSLRRAVDGIDDLTHELSAALAPLNCTGGLGAAAAAVGRGGTFWRWVLIGLAAIVAAVFVCGGAGGGVRRVRKGGAVKVNLD